MDWMAARRVASMSVKGSSRRKKWAVVGRVKGFASRDRSEVSGNRTGGSACRRDRLFAAAFFGQVAFEGVHLAEAGEVPRDFLWTPHDPNAGEENTLQTAGTHDRLGDMVDHILTERAVGKPKRLLAELAVQKKRDGYVGVDGDDTVAGSEGLHDRVGGLEFLEVI
jgi:hypothetical protein